MGSSLQRPSLEARIDYRDNCSRSLQRSSPVPDGIGRLPGGNDPVGIRVSLPVVGKEGFCIAVKDAGDHKFDVTHGLEIVAQARPSLETKLVAGSGVGRIVARGLCDEVGRPAISPSARQQIMNAIYEGLEETGLDHVLVELSLPRGLELAKETLNPRLGIMGGISILGSTGFVEPWNDHFTSDRIQELKGANRVVVTTGRTGLKFSRILFPDHKAVLMGSQLDRLAFEADQESILCGLPALILKWAWPGVLDGTNYGTVQRWWKRSRSIGTSPGPGEGQEEAAPHPHRSAL